MTTTKLPIQGVFNAESGNLVGVASGQALEIPLGHRSTGLRAVFYGHSYMDREDTSGTFAMNATYAYGTVNWANALMGHPFTVVKGAGVGGERIIDVLQRYNVHVAPYNPDIIFISLGHNDLNNVVNTIGVGQIGTGIPYAADTTQTFITNVVTRFGKLLDQIPSHVIVVLLAETQPGRNPSGTASAATHKQLGSRFGDLNFALQRMALRRRNTIYVPVDLPILDATSVNYEIATGMYQDNVHPGYKAAYRRARLLVKHLERYVPKTSAPLVSNVGDAFLNQRLAFTAISGDGTNITVTMDNSAPSTHATIGRIKTGDMVNVQCPNTPAFDGTYLCVAGSPTSITLAGAATGNTTTGNVCTSRQMIENPVFTVQTGGSKSANVTLSSGAVPQSYSLNTTAGAGVVSVAVTYETHADVDSTYSCGSWVVLDITTTGAGDLILQGTASDEGGGSYYKRLHSGEICYAGCEVDVSGAMTNFIGVELRELFSPVNNVVSEFYHDPSYTVGDGPDTPYRATLMTPEIGIPTGFNGITSQIYIRFSGAGAAKVKIARNCLYRVDDTYVRSATDKLAVQ